MSDHRVTIRLTEAEHQAIKTKALAAGASVAETIRALIENGGEGDAQVGSIAEVMTAMLDRLEQIETRDSGASAPPDLTPILRQLAGFAERQNQTESALHNLARAVEKLYQSPGVAVPRQPTASPMRSEAQAHEMPKSDGKKPAPPGGFMSWVREQPFASNDEQPPARAKRLLPIYNAQFDPPHGA